MALKPWYTLVTPREDLREGRPLDASEFAVHLDQVRDKRAPDVYRKPEQFFDRTYLTQNLTGLAAEAIRRLSGEKTETSAVFDLVTQFGGGKTHALTLLYHLAENGPAANAWTGVNKILSRAGVASVPKARTAVFVGTEFDSITGRGGDDGTPVRRTPWGEIAFQLGGEQGFAVVAEHDRLMIAPAGDVIRGFLPTDSPSLILMDELMNYVSRNRKSGLAAQLYDFLHNLSETARGEDNVVLAVSIPASELEMTADDHSDYARLNKLLNRVGKPLIMSAETETSEIIRRRLFEWQGMPDGAKNVVAEYADWVQDHRHEVPNWFPIDNAREAFAATYPFHPIVLSVFERKWQQLPRFQQTRGILRLLALWVSKVFQEGFKGAYRDPLITLGTAPLDDPLFRAAVFEQLGESRLEGAVTTDICGKTDAHAVRLDKEAVDTIKKARLHRKVATAIFFESNGGMTRTEATAPEIRLAVAGPDTDIGNVETATEALTDACYFMTVEGNRYRFSPTENLNKRFADRRANVKSLRIEERVRTEIQKVFAGGASIDKVFFPEQSNQIPDRASLTLVVLSPNQSMQDKKSLNMVDSMTRESGTSSRTFKSALLWAIVDTDANLNEAARKALAWEDIRDEQGQLRLDETQKHQLDENLKKAQRDLRESVWLTYKNIGILGKDNKIRVVDLGLVHSSSAENLVTLIINRLRNDGDIEDSISPNFLVRNWPPAFKAWSTKSARDAFFASPQFPRLLKSDAIKDTIARGVTNKILGYVGKDGHDGYDPFFFGSSLSASDVEISDDMFIITAEEAAEHVELPKLTSLVVSPSNVQIKPGTKQTFLVKGLDQHQRDIAAGTFKWKATGGTVDKEGVLLAGPDEGNYVVTATVDGISGAANFTVQKGAAPPSPIQPPPPTKVTKLQWTGEIPSQKWMNLYTKVLAKFASGSGLRVAMTIEVVEQEGISVQKIEETKVALRELGLHDDVREE